MKKFFTNKIFILLLFLLVICITKPVFGASQYFFWVNTEAEERGPFKDKTTCEDYIKANINKDRTKSACYIGEAPTITKLSVNTGKAGDTVIITGTNFVKITKVIFGTGEATSTNDSTTIYTNVPKNATTGKITIISETRGQVVSTEDFTITAPDKTNWYYTNINKQILGKDGLSAKIPFANQDECQKALDAAYKGSTTYDKNVIKCVEMTQTELDKNKAAEAENLKTDAAKKAAEDAKQSIDAVNKIHEYKTDYNLLAPIGGLEKISSVDKDGYYKVGDYLNIILMIAIGLCGALAVIMIVIYGVQYMGDESVFGKTEAKGHIIAAIGGLLLALAAYAILNTINPALTGGTVKLTQVNITISASDTSTGSSMALCVPTPPPNVDAAKGSPKITLNPAEKKYKEEIDKMTSIPKGNKLLMIAQTHVEGFFEGSKSYRTNNPGNIGNKDDGTIQKFDTLAEGITAQSEMYKRIGTNTSPSYVINGKYDKCVLAGESYDGSLYQYLWIYSTGARQNNSYVNQVIGYFAQEGKTITARTKMSDIYKMK